MIPDYQSCMRPALELLAGAGPMRSREVKDALADEFGLDDDERAATLPSGRQRVMDNRVGWALTYLAQAGLVHRPTRGVVEITERGRQVLADLPAGTALRTKDLEGFSEFVDFQQRTRSVAPQASAAGPDVDDTLTPDDALTRAVAQNRAAVEREALARAMSLTPYAFENLVITLLERMGYGHAGSVERTSASGDAGVDGIISQDPLGLDRIYVQAKRYAQDNVIHRPRIHEFAGALLGKQGDRGVYITTSSFSVGALAEADRINARIELIDGQRLAELLVRYRVGVQVEQTVELLRMDEDFYEGL